MRRKAAVKTLRRRTTVLNVTDGGEGGGGAILIIFPLNTSFTLKSTMKIIKAEMFEYKTWNVD